MISYKTNHPCGPHDVEIWIHFLLDFNKNKLRRECSKRHGVLEKWKIMRGHGNVLGSKSIGFGLGGQEHVLDNGNSTFIKAYFST